MATDNMERLRQFLSENLQLRDDEVVLVFLKLAPYFETIPDSLMADFLHLGQEVTLVPVAQQQFSMIGDLDAIIAAPEFHKLIFENPFFRIFESVIKPRQIVPFHIHRGDCLILTVQGSRFISNDGVNRVVEEWYPMVERIEGNEQVHSFQNVGSADFLGLVFEIKK